MSGRRGKIVNTCKDCPWSKFESVDYVECELTNLIHAVDAPPCKFRTMFETLRDEIRRLRGGRIRFLHDVLAHDALMADDYVLLHLVGSTRTMAVAPMLVKLLNKRLSDEDIDMLVEEAKREGSNGN